MPFGGNTVSQLAAWDQAAPRAYTTNVLCFPTDGPDTSHDDISNHIRDSIRRLAVKRRDFAGRLILGGPDGGSRGRLEIHTSPTDFIPFEVMSKDFTTSYDELKKGEFPASPFVNPDFIINCPLEEGDHPVPVSQVRVLYIKGGFLLFVHLHHAYGDGGCMCTLIELLASETVKADLKAEQLIDERRSCTLHLSLGKENSQKTFDELLAECPEYGLLPGPTGPTQPIIPSLGLDKERAQLDSSCKAFVINTSKLDILCKISKTVKLTKYFVLAALAWAHTTQARLATDPHQAAYFAGCQPIFHNPHDWSDPRKKLFADNESLKRYFGNSIALPVTRSVGSSLDLVAACDWMDAVVQGQSPTKILAIAESIQRANRVINEDFVLKRTALFMAAPDVRYLGITMDSRAPQNFSMNTWAFIGNNTRFWFPGASLEETKGRPEAIRRVQGALAASPHGLILPARPGIAPDELELLATLPRAAMQHLERDVSWMSLVKRVVG